MRRAYLALALVLSATLPLRADDETDKDLNTLQGQWSMTQQTENGPKVRIVKEVKGNKETYTVYEDGKDDPLYAHEVTFKLEKSGPVRLFIFTDQVVTQGPNKGQKGERDGAYIYKVDAESFYEINGLLDDPRELARGAGVRVLKWARVK